jgi:enolase-phosphatase E1
VPAIDLTHIRVILLDIEGTTTPLDFVHQTLFGYARVNLGIFLQANSSKPEVHTCVAGLKLQHAIDDKEKRQPPAWLTDSLDSETASAVQYGLWLMDRDSKVGSLKALQGLIWQQGYRAGRLKGQVYPDVPRAFDRWQQQAKDVSIYSSGSELAQRLLFSTTEAGDLTRYISTFFDTQVGAKTSAESFRRIASLKGHQEDRFLFLSDTLAELDAARAAGMRTVLVARAAGSETRQDGHPTIDNFDELV